MHVIANVAIYVIASVAIYVVANVVMHVIANVVIHVIANAVMHVIASVAIYVIASVAWQSLFKEQVLELVHACQVLYPEGSLHSSGSEALARECLVTERDTVIETLETYGMNARNLTAAH